MPSTGFPTIVTPGTTRKAFMQDTSEASCRTNLRASNPDTPGGIGVGPGPNVQH